MLPGAVTHAPGNDLDAHWMRAAVALGRRGLGRTWPNPAVGCIILREGRVVARGWTRPGGRPHAEAVALAAAGPLARGATVFVSLEPCSHHGKTPPCADALVAAGVGRIVVAIEDPDPRVCGRGIATLRAAGIPVQVGVEADAASEANLGFLTRVRLGRPAFTLKAATSLDGRIATMTGDSRWITGDDARAEGHGLRADHDAIMVGIGTALADDPELTCRLPGLFDRSPVRIVVDGSLRLPLASRLVQSAAEGPPLWIVCRDDASSGQRAALEDAGAVVLPLPADPEGLVDPGALGAALGARGLTRVLVEGGGRLSASLLRAGLVDRLVWFRAPMLLGSDGRPAIDLPGLTALSDVPRFVRLSVGTVGNDIVETYRRVD